ncbi:autotransporter domain-containing protein [Martelella mediterranea]|uniref:autotransporter domain-containing protein n=1 Tax=Martelella mediterranea TaxID=293089 RepID=UPI001E49532D|nr:autotransporter domain-containing protein [Martelella mediterranea]MCD1632627.1 autotransporter domain-containing protein [Martelella mediterranea]
MSRSPHSRMSSIRNRRTLFMLSASVFVLGGLSLMATAEAADFTVPPASGSQTVSGDDRGVIESGATLTATDAQAILWDGSATGGGISIINNGTIDGKKERAIDTEDDVSGRFALTNNGTIKSKKADAFRVDSALENGTVIVDNSGIITTDGGQALDFNSATSESAAVGITNRADATITSSDTDAIRLGAGTITLVNDGTISTTKSDKRAISFDDDENFETLSSFALTNGVSGVITATDDALKIKADKDSSHAASITIDNAGEISSSDGGQALDLADIIAAGSTITITNRQSGTISAADNDGIKAGNGTIVDNYGLIRSDYAEGEASDQNNSAIKLDNEDADGMALTVNNYAGATITGAYHGVKASGENDVLIVTNAAGGTIEGRNGSGVNSNGSGSIVNYGLISGTFDPAADFGDGDGVDFDHRGEFYNYGQILGLGSKGTKGGETKPSTSEAIATGGGIIVNGSADYTGALISGADNGILDDNSNNGDAYAALTVTNYGTIEGKDGFGIKMVNDAGTFGNTVINYGAIKGTEYAVSMGNGDDRFVYQAGSSVTGYVDAEGGTDTFEFGARDGAFDLGLLGSTATYRNFEALAFASGSNWTLSGETAIASAMTLSGATLRLDGSLANIALDMGAGAWLAGNGTIGDLTVGDGATVSPGNSIGLINVAGDVSFAPGSTLIIETDGMSGAADLVAATGSATLSGGNLSLMMADPAANWSNAYTVLTADGGVSGSFDNVSSNAGSIFLATGIDYGATVVTVQMARNNVAFADYAVTANERAAANALDALPQSSALYGAVVVQDGAGATEAFDALSGDIHASLKTGLIEDSRYVRAAAFSRLDDAVGAPGFWLQPFGGWGTTDGDGNASGLDRSTGGVLGGGDFALGDTARAGIVAGYQSSRYEEDGSDAKATADTFLLGVYGGGEWQGFGLSAGAAYGWSTVDTARTAAFPGFSEYLSGSTDAGTAQIFGEASYQFDMGAATLQPFANLAYVNLHTDGYSETGGAAALSVASGDTDTTFSTLGLRASTDFDISNGGSASLSGMIGWRHAFGTTVPNAANSFAGGMPFVVDGAPIAENAAVVEAGLDFDLGAFGKDGKGRAALGVFYAGQFGDGSSDNSVQGRLTLTF